MWRIDHYLTVDYDMVLQTFRRVSKHLEDSKKIGLSPGEETFFFPGDSRGGCLLLAFDSFLTVIFPDVRLENKGSVFGAENLQRELLFLSERARCPVFSMIFPEDGSALGWTGACDSGKTAQGGWGVPGAEPDFSSLSLLLRLPGQEEALRQAWQEKAPEDFLRAMELATGLPFCFPGELEGGYQKVEDRMAMKLYRPLAPALDRFFYFPQEEEKPPDTSGEDLFSLLGRGSLHLYREGLEEQKFLETLRTGGDPYKNGVTVLMGHRYITIWRQSGAPFSPEETERLSLLLHCGAMSTLVCGERAFSLYAAYDGERVASACWQDFSPGAWGIEQRCRMAWQAWLREYPHSDGIKTQEAARFCNRFGISPGPFMEAVRFGNLPYLLEKLPSVMGTYFEIPGSLKDYPAETLSCGKLYREPEKKGPDLWT